MNLLGKSLVLVFGMFAIFCLMLGVAVYTQPMGFVTTPKETAKVTQTRVGQAIEQTKRYQIAIDRANTRWVEEYDSLATTEAEQFRRRDFYRTQMELVTTGKLDGKEEAAPVQELKTDVATNKLEIDLVTGRPPVKVKLGTENALPQKVYDDAIKQIAKDVEPLQKQTKEAGDELVIATNKMNGTDKFKGLRTRIKEQEQIAADADLERIYLEDFVTNRRADAELFVKRQRQLESQIARLVDYLKKQGEKGN